MKISEKNYLYAQLLGVKLELSTTDVMVAYMAHDLGQKYLQLQLDF